MDEKGEIQYMDATLYINDGHSKNENENSMAINSIQTCYDSRRWKVKSFGVITDAPSNSFMRAPGRHDKYVTKMFSILQLLTKRFYFRLA